MWLPSLFALRALEAAVRLRGYSAAARELSVTQGAISQQIRKLEAELGDSLFRRLGNEMIPTAGAVRLAEEVAGAVASLQGAIDDFAAAAERKALVLSVDGRFSNRWLAPKLPRLLADPAGANLDIRVEDRVANFTADGVDVAVRFGRGDWPSLLSERLTSDRLYVVCTPQFAAKHRISTARDLAKAPLIHSTDRPWSMLFERLQLPTPPMIGPASNDSVLVLDAVARGVGAAIVRSSMVDDDLASGCLVRPVPDSLPLPLDYVRPGQLVRPVADPEPPDYGYFVVWRPDNRQQRRIRLLRDWLTAERAPGPAEPGGF
jgi:LysR family glycine cleavage system transcriptional activator